MTKVARRGSGVPVRLDRRELEVVWALAHRSRMSGPVRAARHRETLGLPRVSDREAERRLKDNRARIARRHRAAARAREGATATLGAPEVPATPALHYTVRGDVSIEERYVALGGTSRAEPNTTPARTYSPCERCLHCHCRQLKDYSAAQNSSPSPARHSHAARRRSASRRRRPSSSRSQRQPPRTPSPGPPQLW